MILVSLFSLSFIFTLWSAGTAKFTIRQLLFFCWLSLSLVVWPKLGNSLSSQNPREFSAFHSLGQILGCAYIICSYGQISISCTTPTTSPPCRVFNSFCFNLLFVHLIINRFVSFITSPTFTILLYRVHFYFNIVSPYGVNLCCYYYYYYYYYYFNNNFICILT